MENPINRQPFEPGSKIVSTYHFTVNYDVLILENPYGLCLKFLKIGLGNFLRVIVVVDKLLGGDKP